ncbi:hypothetical protein H1R20_g8140, partial [Candolleomyces eurysporus]
MGKQFIRVWSRDGNKVVLRYEWVAACVEAKRILREDNDWGEFMTVDDGLPIDDIEDPSEPEQKSPLPTPRQSPAHPPTPTPQPSHGKPSSSGSKQLAPSGTLNGSQPRQSQPFIQPLAQTGNGANNSPANAVSGVPVVPEGTFLMALADVLAHNPSPDLQAQGAQLQNLMPTYTPPPTMGDVDMEKRARADRPVSAKAWGKQPEGSSVSSRKSSFSQPPPSSLRSSESSPAYNPLFTKRRTGVPMKFFVQVGYPRRAELVTSIKKNGGTIEANLVDANFVILFANVGKNTKDYQNYLQSAVSAGVPAVRGQFIHDCIDQGQILDYKYYTFDPPSKKVKAKGKRVASPSPSSDSEDEPLSQKLQQSKSKPVTSSQPTKRVKRVSTPSASQPTPTLKPSLPRPSPKQLPKPATAPVTKQAFKYTADELQAAVAIAFEVCKKNPEALEHEIAVEVHKQIPHHTLNSWKTYMGQTKRTEFMEARKKGGIAHRKEKARQQVQQRVQQLKAEQEEEDPARTDEQDVETFSDFLAFHGGDQLSGENQAAAFEALSKMAPQRTPAGWEQFWGRYNVQITERYHPKAAKQMELEQTAADDMYIDEDISGGDGIPRK